MKRWMMAQTLWYATLKIRPIIIPAFSIVPQWVEQLNPSCRHYLLTCRHWSKTSTTTTKSWCGLGSTNDYHNSITTRNFVTLRGGSDGNVTEALNPTGDQKYTVLSDPAPGSPFHYAFPVHNLELAKEFYGNVLGCVEGRSSTKWQDYSLHGHQIVAHWVGDNYRCQDYYNPVDGDEVPVPRTSMLFSAGLNTSFLFHQPHCMKCELI